MWGRRYNSQVKSPVQLFLIGRVKSIVLGPYKGNTNERDPDYNTNADIGKIRYQLLYNPINPSFSEAVSEPAWPINGFVKQYPLINEIVMIMLGPSSGLNDSSTSQKSFYFPPFGLWNDSNHNGFPDLREYNNFLNKYINKPGYSSGETQIPNFPLGYTFQEKKDIKNLKPFEGDVLLQSRYGQSIRFGSTVSLLKKENSWSNAGSNGDPITIILNQQGSRAESNQFSTFVEDINRDGSAIYMTSTQEIRLDLLGFPLNSFNTSIDPVREDIVIAREIPISDQYTSAEEQDSYAFSIYEKPNTAYAQVSYDDTQIIVESGEGISGDLNIAKRIAISDAYNKIANRLGVTELNISYRILEEKLTQTSDGKYRSKVSVEFSIKTGSSSTNEI